MEKMLFIEQNTEEKSSNLAQVVEIAERNGAELSAVFFIRVSLETADWIEVQEKLTADAEKRANNYAQKIRENLEGKGVSFTWQVVQLTPSAFIKALEEAVPADIIIAGRMDLDVLSEKGIKHLEDISVLFGCPVMPVSSLLPEKVKHKGKALVRFAGFAALSAASYLLFFPQIAKLNNLIYMKGTILGGLAVMVTVPIHAYIYGSFTDYIPKLLGLEKSAGNHH